MTIEQEIKAFLAKGGKIQTVPMGIMAHNSVAWRDGLAEYRKREAALKKEREAKRAK